MWFSYTWKAKEKCPCPHPSLLSSKISPQAGTPHQSRGTKAGLSISAPHSPLHMAQPHLGNPQGNLSEEIILPKIQMQGAACPLTREEFICTPELEGFEFATAVLRASQKGGMAGATSQTWIFSCSRRNSAGQI